MVSILRNSASSSFCLFLTEVAFLGGLIFGNIDEGISFRVSQLSVKYIEGIGLAFRSSNAFFLYRMIYFLLKMINAYHRMFTPLPIISVDKLYPFLPQVLVVRK